VQQVQREQQVQLVWPDFKVQLVQLVQLEQQALVQLDQPVPQV
jgi:hypothetical protein